MTVIVLLILILVGIPLLIWRVMAHRDKKKIMRRREELAPLVKQRYDNLIAAIEEEYPLIKFSFLPVEKLLNDCVAFKFEFPARSHIQEALIPLIENVSEAFLCPPIELHIENIDARESAIQKGIGDDEFWTSELKHRTTRGKGLPGDWSTRRKVVHNRDNGQCRRCGLEVPLTECHIHHLKRKSKGGMHSFDNLVTLCKDCHALMPEHEGMKADMYYQSIGSRLYYYVSNTNTIHQEYCQHAHNAKRVSDLYTRLLERGLKPCKKCNPAKVHEDGIGLWTPSIATFAEERIGIYHWSEPLEWTP